MDGCDGTYLASKDIFEYPIHDPLRQTCQYIKIILTLCGMTAETSRRCAQLEVAIPQDTVSHATLLREIPKVAGMLAEGLYLDLVAMLALLFCMIFGISRGF